MSSVNKVILIGNVGADPELRFLPNGNAVLNFRMATTEKWTDRDGQRQEKTEWHRVQQWGKLAEQVHALIFKGCKVYVEGKLQSREYEDRQGQKRTVVEINAWTVISLTKRDQSRREPQDEGGHHADPIPF